jgi:hypothetical protein
MSARAYSRDSIMVSAAWFGSMRMAISISGNDDQRVLRWHVPSGDHRTLLSELLGANRQQCSDS